MILLYHHELLIQLEPTVQPTVKIHRNRLTQLTNYYY